MIRPDTDRLGTSDSIRATTETGRGGLWAEESGTREGPKLLQILATRCCGFRKDSPAAGAIGVLGRLAPSASGYQVAYIDNRNGTVTSSGTDDEL